MQDTYNTIEEHLDLTLAQMCLKLDATMYEEVLTSYEALGRRHAICDRLGSHFITAIHAVSHSIARENAGLAPRKGLGLGRMRDAGGGARQAQFKALCAKLNPDKFENCLVELCEGMCRIMIDYNGIVDRHAKEDEDEAAAAAAEGDRANGEGAAVSPEAAAAAAATAAAAAAASRVSPREYEQMKFEVHRGRIWQDIQRQVATYMLEIALSKLPLNTFLQLLGHVRRFVSIGEDFSEQKSELLEKVIRQKSLTYFWDSHRRMLETLRDQMNRDAWTGMAVVKDFNIFFLKEFSFLRQQQKSPKRAQDDGAYSGSDGQLRGFAENNELFRQGRLLLADKDVKGITEGASGGAAESPFPATAAAAAAGGGDAAAPPSPLKSAGASGAAVAGAAPAGPAAGLAAPGAGTAAAAAASKQPKLPPPPHCSEACMLVVRCFGKYLQMMDVLKAISSEVFDCMLELYYFYLDTVWQFFVRENTLTYPDTVLSPRARAALQRLTQTKQPPPETLTPINAEMAKRPSILSEIAENSPPTISSNCDTTSESGLYVRQLPYLFFFPIFLFFG